MFSKYARGEGWGGDSRFFGTIWLSVSWAEGRVAFVYTEARIALSVLSLVSCTNKKDELSFFFNRCRINYAPYGYYWSRISARNASKSPTTMSNDGLASGSWFQHLSMSCQHCSGNTSNLCGVLLSTAFIMSITRGRKWRFIFCGWLPWPSHTRQSNIPNAYTSMDLSYCCFIISGAMLIGVPTNELLMRPSGLQRPRSVNLALFFSSNWKERKGENRICWSKNVLYHLYAV